ncbi:MAG: bifunctional 3,4-dihydroxy-2-butanone-4-phosphate synthase/GTP cyclohydrolase II, partial [Nitrosomonadaceae bacterium]|nr:bifunctional 3,4-dihydroxy-2-butanone-4-phosphate synthase/GTP cyclohydrolase II [Nitrosomonadaceae bacterium]
PLSVVDLLDIHDNTHSWNIHDAMKLIAEAGQGVIVLLHRKESPAKLIERVQSQDTHVSGSLKPDLRDHGIGAQILKDLNVGKMRLMATPRKMPSMTGFGLEVTRYVEK